MTPGGSPAGRLWGVERAVARSAGVSGRHPFDRERHPPSRGRRPRVRRPV